MPFALALPFAARAAVLSRGDRRRAYPLAHPPRLADYLPPPPAADSATAVADLGAVLEAQRLRTPEQVRRVRAHDQWEDNVFPFAGDLLGASFDKERLPLTRASSTAPRKTWSRC